MKKYFVLLVASIFVFCIPAKSQDTMHIKIGFFFSPQGTISLQTPEKGFSALTPVLFVTQFSKGKGGVNVMYNMTYNNIQLVYFHSLYKKIGTYLIASKRVLANGGYAGTGLTRSVADGRAVGFFEFGSAWNKWSPALYTGVIIPLTLKLK